MLEMRFGTRSIENDIQLPILQDSIDSFNGRVHAFFGRNAQAFGLRVDSRHQYHVQPWTA